MDGWTDPEKLLKQSSLVSAKVVCFNWEIGQFELKLGRYFFEGNVSIWSKIIIFLLFLIQLG